MITLDGSYGEGGGALVRTALALSALTGKELSVKNIRAGREQGGLKAQHLTAIKALKEICSAETNEVQLGSTELYFKPGRVKAGTYVVDIGTAGSISLLLQALILPCMFASNKVTLTIMGGTCGKGQASVDYIQNVLLPHLQKLANIRLRIWKRGYYPKGGGKVTVEISPLSTEINLLPIILTEPEKVEQIRGVVNCSTDLQDKQVAERVKSSAEHSLRELRVPIQIRMEYGKTDSTGGEIVLWAIGKNHRTRGSDALLELKKSSEQAGKEAAEKLKKELASGMAVDHYLADQLIPFLGKGSEIRAEISEHARTNMYVVEKFMPVRFECSRYSIKVKEEKDL